MRISVDNPPSPPTPAQKDSAKPRTALAALAGWVNGGC